MNRCQLNEIFNYRSTSILQKKLLPQSKMGKYCPAEQWTHKIAKMWTSYPYWHGIRNRSWPLLTMTFALLSFSSHCFLPTLGIPRMLIFMGPHILTQLEGICRPGASNSNICSLQFFNQYWYRLLKSSLYWASFIHFLHFLIVAHSLTFYGCQFIIVYFAN